MVQVSIQHIIGTAALIGLAVSLALAYQIVVSSVEISVLKSQLSQVAEYVSMSASNIISLADFTYGIFKEYVTVSKSLNLPANLGGKIYTIKLMNDIRGLYVLIEVPGRSDLYATSAIPINPSINIQVVIEEGVFTPSDSSIKPKSLVYGGNPNVVIWCEYRDKVLYVGLGLRES